MESLCNLIQHIKETDTGWELLFKQLQPLIRKSAKKLFFLEYENAEQEICLAVFSAVQTISHYNSDGECLKYIANGIHFACSALFSSGKLFISIVYNESACSLYIFLTSNGFFSAIHFLKRSHLA